MVLSAVRARKFPLGGRALVSNMKHVKTTAKHKGSDVAITYDGQFHLQRLRRGLLRMTSSRTCLRNSMHTVRFRGNHSRSPFVSPNGSRKRPVTTMHTIKTTVPV